MQGRLFVVVALAAPLAFVLAAEAPFFSSAGPAFDEPLNVLWRTYGLGEANPMSGQPMLGGRKWWGQPVSASDGDWTELKLGWRDDAATLRSLRQWLMQLPVDADGYAWAAADGRLHLGQHRLQHTSADFINGLWEFWRWNGDLEWLTNAVPRYAVAAGGDGRGLPSAAAFDFLHYLHGDGMSLSQTFAATQAFSVVRLRLALTEKSRYEIRLVAEGEASTLASERYAGRTNVANAWAALALPQACPAGRYCVELRNLGRYHHERLGWYGSERGGGSAMNGLAEMSPLARARLAMEHQLGDAGMRGRREGVVVIAEPDQAGTPQPIGRRAGGAMPCTYYDLVRSGHKEAFVNARFLKSLASLAALEEAAGFAERAAALRAQLARSRAAFHRIFWNPKTGRYAGWVDAEGRMWDYGEVEYNLEALLWAEPPPEAARSVLDWISGRRAVAGDTSTGADIYAWGFAPRKNTRAYESFGAQTNHWWGGWYWDFRPDGSGRANFGNQEENGGSNPFIGYYDVLARLKYNGPADAWQRFYAASNSVLRDFARDQWLRPTRADANHPGERYKSYVLDLPEAGLAALAALHGFMGVCPDGNELRIQPRLPPGVERLGVRGLHFKGRRYTVEACADGTFTVRPEAP